MGQDARLMALLHLTALSHQAEQQALSAAPAQTAAEAVESSAAGPLDGLLCACCEKSFLSLTRHLLVEHGLDEASYRGRYGLALDVPLVAPSYGARKAACLSAYGGGALPL